MSMFSGFIGQQQENNNKIMFFIYFLCLLSRSYLLTPAVEPSCGDRADVSRCVNEQHDGEDIRSMLHGPHVGCARAGEHSRGLT